MRGRSWSFPAKMPRCRLPSHERADGRGLWGRDYFSRSFLRSVPELPNLFTDILQLVVKNLLDSFGCKWDAGFRSSPPFKETSNECQNCFGQTSTTIEVIRECLGAKGKLSEWLFELLRNGYKTIHTRSRMAISGNYIKVVCIQNLSN